MYRRRQTASLRLTRMPEFHLVGFLKTVLPRSECKENIFIDQRHRNCNLQISKAPLESQAQSTSLFTSAASSQTGCPRDLSEGGAVIQHCKHSVSIDLVPCVYVCM